MVSAFSGPLDEELFRGYEHLHVEVDDVEDENIMRYFPEVNAFVREGLGGGGGVVVVW